MEKQMKENDATPNAAPGERKLSASGEVSFRTADLKHKTPDTIIGGHEEPNAAGREITGESPKGDTVAPVPAAPEPAPSKKSTLPLSAEQVGHDYFLVMNVVEGRFREGDDVVRAVLAVGRLINQALAAIELERKLSGAKQHAEACFAVARKYGLFKFSSEPPAVYLDRHITELRAAITARNQREHELIRENAELKHVASRLREIVCRRVGSEGALIPRLSDEELTWMDEYTELKQGLK